MQDVALLGKGFEQALELVDARKLGEPHQIGLAGDDVFDAFLRAALPADLLGDRDGIQHHLVDRGVGLLELPQQFRVHLAQGSTAAMVVEKISRTPQFFRAIAALKLDNAVLHFAVVEHQDHEHPVFGERHELYLRQGRCRRQRQGNEPGQVSDA